MSETSAKIIRSTVHPLVPSSVITTVQVTAPRFLLAEINTHGLLAKSAASSRAIPVRKRVEMVRTKPFVPAAFGKNKKGMQASEVLADDTADKMRDLWIRAANYAADVATIMADNDMHKQHANRILEPFAYYTGVITATEWDNFFELRLHPDAQPEFQELAKHVKKAMDESVPVKSNWHHPFVDDQDFNVVRAEDWMKVSSARCARISYTLFDGSPSTMQDDLALCAKLIEGGHMSPFDHVANSDVILDSKGHTSAWFNYDAKSLQYWASPRLHGRYWGWIPERHFIELGLNKKTRRDSFEGFNS